jgi:hypothetical protein
MGQQGIYAAPCNNVPNRDREIKCTETITQKLWIVEFEIKGVGNGCSVVKSPNARGAEVLLKTQGIFNGTPSLYKITRIEEIVMSPDSMLICEQIND